MLRIADLVDDDPTKRDKVSAALKDPAQNGNRDHVDIIIALGMAKEGFDWIWCEHALTVGYRSSLTEIVQIIGRATRDAEGKTRARFTNLIAEPDASEDVVTEAVNETLKAIAASLLMEQVLAPRFNFTPKNPNSGPVEGCDYGEGGYDPEKCNVGFNEESGQFQIEIKGLAEPKSKEAERICQEDLNEVITAFVQDKTAIEQGLFNEEVVPEELTQVRMGKIIKDRYPELDDADAGSCAEWDRGNMPSGRRRTTTPAPGSAHTPAAGGAGLRKVRDEAFECGSLGTAARAIELLGKTIGVFAERPLSAVSVEVRQSPFIIGETPEERRRSIERLKMLGRQKNNYWKMSEIKLVPT